MLRKIRDKDRENKEKSKKQYMKDIHKKAILLLVGELSHIH
jgi:hypothetical protein